MISSEELLDTFRCAVATKRRVVIYTANRIYKGEVDAWDVGDVTLRFPTISVDCTDYRIGVEEILILLEHIEAVGIIEAPRK